MKTRVGVARGAGYAGGELLRLLLSHPRVELAAVSSQSQHGQPVTRVHPHLRLAGGLKFEPTLNPAGLDAVFLCGSHGSSMRQVPELLAAGPAGLRLLDLSSDFRLRESALYRACYGHDHAAPGLLESFVYGQPELNGAAVKAATRVANPGCFATAAILALGPLAGARIKARAHVTAVTGSSGSGALPSPVTHHPAREGSLRAYKPLAHPHVPEITQLLDALSGGSGLPVSLVPISGPFVRGIYAVCQVELPAECDEARVRGLYERAYSGRPFVSIVPQPPDLKTVVGTNHCDIHLAFSKGTLSVIAALDNLVKGAAGQAVQNLNLMMGWPETEGLASAGVYP